MNKEMNVDNRLEELANKCLRQVKNKIYFNHKALSPAIYRMPIEFLPAGLGIFGTDATKIYAEPTNVILRYKKSPDELVRIYLHMLFHCIYLHPFLTKYGVNTAIWDVAIDICAEAAVMRLKPVLLNGDTEREQIIKSIGNNVKMFIPELVYKELINNSNKDTLAEMAILFHMDEHLWMEDNDSDDNSGNSGGNNNDDDNDYQNPNQQPQQNNDNNQDNEQNGDNGSNNGDNGNDKNENQGDQNGNGNNSSNNNDSKNQNTRGNNGSGGNSLQNQQKKQEWSDVSRQVATDMQSFHGQGTDSGNTVQEIEFLTQDKMDYEEFLRQFSIIEEKMMVNQDEFDYMYYTYGLTKMKRPDGTCGTDKSVLLIEPLEYKEEKVIKDFVIAIDTSGSCSGELVKKFLNKTYSILKESESFSSKVNIHIVQCDAKVQHDTKITNINEMEGFMQNMKLYGFGGTDFRPVFKYVDELIAKKEFENLCGLIYFTDGYGTYPTKPTPYKTAFAFLEDYSNRDNVPAWAMSVYWKEDDM